MSKHWPYSQSCYSVLTKKKITGKSKQPTPYIRNHSNRTDIKKWKKKWTSLQECPVNFCSQQKSFILRKSLKVKFWNNFLTINRKIIISLTKSYICAFKIVTSGYLFSLEMADIIPLLLPTKNVDYFQKALELS